MSVSVVKVLEMVEIHHQDAQRNAELLAALQLVLEREVQRLLCKEPGQGVILDLLLDCLMVFDVFGVVQIELDDGIAKAYLVSVLDESVCRLELLTNVLFVLPKSMRRYLLGPSSRILACCLETVSSGMEISQSLSRPITYSDLRSR